MDKKLEQLFFTALGGALAVKDKLEANSDEINAWRSETSTENGNTICRCVHTIQTADH